MAQLAAADKFVASLGFEAYRVGGSVRDELLGRKTKDADYVVYALPRPLMDSMRKAGAKPSSLTLHNQPTTVGVRAHIPKVGLIECMMPRYEVSTGPGHADFEIHCGLDVTLAQDAERRDFTINALYRLVFSSRPSEGQSGIFDPTGKGLSDLDSRIIRCTHTDSFRDDPLRILRAARFASQLGFSLDPLTYHEMMRHSAAVDGLTEKGVSGTALVELEKMLMGVHVAYALRGLAHSGALATLLPELKSMLGFHQGSRYHNKTCDEHTFDTLDVAARVNARLRVRIALLFHDCGKPATGWLGDDNRLHYYAHEKNGFRDHEDEGADLAAAALARLNAPRDLRRDVDTLIRRHMVSLSGRTKPTKIRRWRSELGDSLLQDLIVHRFCDVLGKDDDHENPNPDTVKAIDALQRIADIRREAKNDNVPISIRDLALSGGELAEMGFVGPAIGAAQRALLHEVLSNPDLNERNWLISRASDFPKNVYVEKDDSV